MFCFSAYMGFRKAAAWKPMDYWIWP